MKGMFVYFRFLLLLLFSLSASLTADDASGYGWRVPHTPLYLGGHISANYDDDAHEEKRVIFDDIALQFYGNFERVSLLGEIEASDVPLEKMDLALHIERLRLAWYQHDDTTITLGKFNSDIGFWNQIPINILQDTTTYPNILEHIFPKLTTGIMLTRTREANDDEISLTIQHNNDFDRHYNNIPVDRHYGIAFKKSLSWLIWRLNGGYYRTLDKHRYYYGGIGARRETYRYTLTGELFTRQGKDRANIPYDGYCQLTWHLFYRHDLAFRTEYYRDQALHVHENISLVGYTYRPRPSVAIKAELVRHTQLPKSRLVLSLSAMF
jgi:hypothetical protein